MLIGLEKKFIFVANTKTASTSIESALLPYAEIHHAGDPRRKHMPIRKVKATYPKVFETPGQELFRFFKFGVMRDPIDWIGSWFRYRKGNKVESPLPRDMSFSEFWEMQDWNVLKPDGSRFLQRHMFCGPEGDVQVDVIIPYPQLNAMFGEICDCLGVVSQLPRENVSRMRDFDIPLEMEKKLYAHFEPDYALMARLDEINAKGMEKLRARAAA